MDGLYYYCIVVEFSRSNSKCLMYTSVQTTVFSHIVAMATILFWNCKTLKISNKNLNSFLSGARKLFKGGKY